MRFDLLEEFGLDPGIIPSSRRSPVPNSSLSMKRCASVYLSPAYGKATDDYAQSLWKKVFVYSPECFVGRKTEDPCFSGRLGLFWLRQSKQSAWQFTSVKGEFHHRSFRQ